MELTFKHKKGQKISFLCCKIGAVSLDFYAIIQVIFI